MDRRGFLLGEEVVKMVVAAICLGFLIYFLTSLYFTKLHDEKLQQARATLERVSEIIADKDVEEASIDMVNPSGWYVFGFAGEGLKPNNCLGKDCLCICPKVLFRSQEKTCDRKGVCIVVEGLNPFLPFKIKSGGRTSILINKINGINIREK